MDDAWDVAVGVGALVDWHPMVWVLVVGAWGLVVSFALALMRAAKRADERSADLYEREMRRRRRGH